MSYATDIATMMAEAQTILAPMCDSSDGAFTLSSMAGTFTGILNEQDGEDPLDMTGVKRVRYLFIFATKDQFTTAPSAAPRCTVTVKGASWSVQGVTDLPQHYRIVCRPL